MKIVALLIFASSAAAAVGAANAADLPVKAAPAVVPPVATWTGFYVGANVGFAWGDGATDLNPLPDPVRFVNLLPQTLKTNPSGIFGGVQLGYNYQLGNFVLGAETDFQGADISGSAAESPIVQNNGTPFAGGNIAITEKVDWFGTLRGRLGTTVVDPRLLLYATGGLAYGHVTDAAIVDFRPVGTAAYPISVSSTRTGWTAGAGGEWAFGNGWSFKAEYLHIDLGSISATANPIIVLPPFQVNYVFHHAEDLVRVGANFKFH